LVLVEEVDDEAALFIEALAAVGALAVVGVAVVRAV
jgi:hypothetical protein